LRSKSAPQATRVAALSAAVAAIHLFASSALAAPVGEPRLNGFWYIDTPSRDVALGLRAELTPAGTAIAQANAAAQAARLARGQVVGLGSYTCASIGAPFFVGTSEPLFLVATEDSVVMYHERRQITARRFYTDGRSWPEMSTMPPSTSGYSIAHWEGPVLVIETRGMPPGGTQGGGQKGPNTILHERLSLSPDGDRLSWAFTWEDPSLMVGTHNYVIEYDRAPPHTYALTHDCDPADGAADTVAGH